MPPTIGEGKEDLMSSRDAEPSVIGAPNAPTGKHTPGPWAVWSSLYIGMAAAVVSGHERGAKLKTVAEVRDYSDALLIAAALDLDAAAREALDFIGSYFGPVASDNPEGWSDADAREVHGKLSAAIAKATGE